MKNFIECNNISKKTSSPYSDDIFYSSYMYDIKEYVDILVKAFGTVITLTDLYYDISYSQGSGACWTGKLDLKTFITNLPKLKKEYPYIYDYFTKDYKKTVNKAKYLIAKLKLQNLPLPWVEVDHNGSTHHYHEKTMNYFIYIEDSYYTVWDYFSEFVENNDTETIQIQEELYLNQVEPVLTDICEAIALIIYDQLQNIYINYDEMV